MKLWGGRFSGRRDPQFEKFSESFSLDQRFVLYDLRVNLAYVKALSQARVLKPREASQLAAGLEALRRKIQHDASWAQGQTAEDVHTWVEAELERLAGDVARKLRTGRSRNDLVATEMRLYVKDATLQLERALADLLAALVEPGAAALGCGSAGIYAPSARATHPFRALPSRLFRNVLPGRQPSAGLPRARR